MLEHLTHTYVAAPINARYLKARRTEVHATQQQVTVWAQQCVEAYNKAHEDDRLLQEHSSAAQRDVSALQLSAANSKYMTALGLADLLQQWASNVDAAVALHDAQQHEEEAVTNVAQARKALSEVRSLQQLQDWENANTQTEDAVLAARREKIACQLLYLQTKQSLEMEFESPDALLSAEEAWKEWAMKMRKLPGKLAATEAEAEAKE